ncbi:hypothetical protein Tco_0116983, partial [Tanacetum coccineum]
MGQLGQNATRLLFGDESKGSKPWWPRLWLGVVAKGARVVTKGIARVSIRGYELVWRGVKGWSLVRAASTASGLEAEQDSGNINKAQSKATPNESSFLGTTSGGGP